MTKNSKNLRWDEAGQPLSSHFNDVYFSRDNGLEESNYVFIQQNQLPQQFASLERPAFTIGETGFGTGLNFLLAWQTWRNAQLNKNNQQHQCLHFISVEQFPLSRDELSATSRLWPQLQHYSRALIDAYPPETASGFHRIEFDRGQVKLTLIFGEAGDCLQQLCQANAIDRHNNPSWWVDCWFLDGFAPAKNPEMWRRDVIQALAKLSRNGTRFATFTAAGAVRRELQQQGFRCEKAPGFGKKRDMLRGEFEQPAAASKPSWVTISPWSAPTSIAIIGGGLAGCTLARCLADRGKQVSLFEQHPALACEGSGNAQGIVYARLSPHNDALSRFNLAAQQFANHFYQYHDFFKRCGEQCGVLHLAGTDKQRDSYHRLGEHYASSGFARWLNREQASLLCGAATRAGGLFIEKSGWLNPPALCRALCQHPNIRLYLGRNIQHIAYDKTRWQLSDPDGNQQYAQALVVACAHTAKAFPFVQGFTTKSIRGQVSHLNESQQVPLKTVLCGEGYIAPPCEGMQSLGASFNLDSADTQLRLEDHQSNLDSIQAMLAQPLKIDPAQLQGRVGFRCTSPDYFPLCGPVADHATLCQRFAAWRKNASTAIDLPGAYHPQLYCHLGFGSRALAYTPLCSEQLASLICGEAPPLQSDLYRHIHPARFAVRDLKRNQI
ncbi:MAG: bifunctional tRNA (5-methylaminomethyl-2-thiouridine)(34)-methyltransferase MnmD/FAD-dependent 5-carboxymethylaminomethyl-2-thiouridine(34) oxidoreductase MnmC [Cellvibrionaceae bacterium]|nr:bifunctional tRNA (5-methylaminomethyl-2-thiouridine)(34)-methyltransferase MnmD/FAD-dependent 5-carboxymethylaminomethyl-2-thiouridine(34) oxidoreductase MnmC [Cellvibrionaceae bacterium]